MLSFPVGFRRIHVLCCAIKEILTPASRRLNFSAQLFVFLVSVVIVYLIVAFYRLNKRISKATLGAGREARARSGATSKVRAKVEHPILVNKRIFGFMKVRGRGMGKNAKRLFVICRLANLYPARTRLLRAPGIYAQCGKKESASRVPVLT